MHRDLFICVEYFWTFLELMERGIKKFSHYDQMEKCHQLESLHSVSCMLSIVLLLSNCWRLQGGTFCCSVNVIKTGPLWQVLWPELEKMELLFSQRGKGSTFFHRKVEGKRQVTADHEYMNCWLPGNNYKHLEKVQWTKSRTRTFSSTLPLKVWNMPCALNSWVLSHYSKRLECALLHLGNDNLSVCRRAVEGATRLLEWLNQQKVLHEGRKHSSGRELKEAVWSRMLPSLVQPSKSWLSNIRPTEVGHMACGTSHRLNHPPQTRFGPQGSLLWLPGPLWQQL